MSAEDSLEQIERRIHEALARKEQARRLARKLAAAEREREAAHPGLRKWRARLSREEEDLRQLERYGLIGLLARFSGNRDARITEAEEGAALARASYLRSRETMRAIRDRIRELQDRIRDIGDPDRDLRALRAEKEAVLSEKGGRAGDTLDRLSEALADRTEALREIKEAESAGRIAQVNLRSILKALHGAARQRGQEGYGEDFIGRAEHGARRAGRNLLRFRQELADVMHLANDGEIEEITGATRVVYEGLTRGFLGTCDLDVSSTHARRVLTTLRRLSKVLRKRRAAVETEISELEAARRELLDSL